MGNRKRKWTESVRYRECDSCLEPATIARHHSPRFQLYVMAILRVFPFKSQSRKEYRIGHPYIQSRHPPPLFCLPLVDHSTIFPLLLHSRRAVISGMVSRDTDVYHVYTYT